VIKDGWFVTIAVLLDLSQTCVDVAVAFGNEYCGPGEAAILKAAP